MKAQIHKDKEDESQSLIVLDTSVAQEIFCKAESILRSSRLSRVTSEDKVKRFLLERLEELIPELICDAELDEEYFPIFSRAESGYSMYFDGISYRIKLEKGDFCACLIPFKDLKECDESLAGKSGFELARGKYVPREKLIVQTHRKMKLGHLIVLNSLCQEKIIDLETIARHTKHSEYEGMECYMPLASKFYPRGFNSQGGELYSGLVFAQIRNPSLKLAKKAENPINEFIDWSRSEKTTIKDAGEMAMLLLEDLNRLTQLTPNHPAATLLKDFNNQLFEKATKLYARLQPPQNDRMQYLETN